MDEKELSKKELDAVSGGAGSHGTKKYVVMQTAKLFRKPVDSLEMHIGTIQAGTRITSCSASAQWVSFLAHADSGIAISSKYLNTRTEAYIQACYLKPLK